MSINFVANCGGWVKIDQLALILLSDLFNLVILCLGDWVKVIICTGGQAPPSPRVRDESPRSYPTN